MRDNYLKKLIVSFWINALGVPFQYHSQNNQFLIVVRLNGGYRLGWGRKEDEAANFPTLIEWRCRISAHSMNDAIPARQTDPLAHEEKPFPVFILDDSAKISIGT